MTKPEDEDLSKLYYLQSATMHIKKIDKAKEKANQPRSNELKLPNQAQEWDF